MHKGPLIPMIRYQGQMQTKGVDRSSPVGKPIRIFSTN